MMDTTLMETFSGSELSERLQWRCEPKEWGVDRDTRRLWIRPEAGTDFWQRTHYGFEADNGHFLGLEAKGDFVLSTEVSFRPVHQYDQAGLMVRISPGCWLKTSVEYEPEGANRLGAVVTNNQYSDWSTQSLGKEFRRVWFRVRAEGSDYFVESSLDGVGWEQIRMARLIERESASSVWCGLYACSPKGAGYRAEFSFLRFEGVKTGDGT